MLAGLYSTFTDADGVRALSVSIITVDPNSVLKSVGHHRSPAIIRSADEAQGWLSGSKQEALELLRPFSDESMGVEQVSMGVKIPGNEKISLPSCLGQR
jgi:putative SOS response-associated peptidase YedK